MTLLRSVPPYFGRGPAVAGAAPERAAVGEGPAAPVAAGAAVGDAGLEVQAASVSAPNPTPPWMARRRLSRRRKLRSQTLSDDISYLLPVAGSNREAIQPGRVL